MIAKCNCESKYQDARYGKDNRVFNKCAGRTGNENKYRCTVCGKEIYR